MERSSANQPNAHALTKRQLNTNRNSMASIEHKSAQFVAQFAATVFAQWKQTQEKERFWLNAAFLRDLLEEAVAKLPKIALKGHLVRELQPAVAELKKLLEAHYAEHQQHESVSTQSNKSATQELLNEEDVERALATADNAKRRELAAVLALDEYTSIATETQEVASVAQIEAYVAQLQRMTARSYESPDELARKRGFFMQRIVGCAEQLVAKWAADKHGNWDCASTGPHSVELQQLRAALQQIVAYDAVAAVSDFGSSTLLATPWTSFYRPSESALFLKVDSEAEIAKVFGVLLTLAIYFPIVLDDEDDNEATSDESSSDSDSDNEPQATSAAKKQAKLDFLEQAKRTVRHVVFAAKQRSDALWLVAVLAFVHQQPKPKSYREDEDEVALVAADQRALQDCLCDVYSRAFANPRVLEAHSIVHHEGDRASDWLLFQTVVCIRHAAQFMRSERRQSIPAVTTAMVKLVSIPLPASFWQWLAHVKKLYALQSPAVRDVMKKLTKNKSSKMANALLSVADVTNEELLAVAEVRYLCVLCEIVLFY